MDKYKSAESMLYSDGVVINNITPFASASGISFFEIGFVESASAGLESISSSQSSTVNNHGGNYLFIYVWQYGYGNVNNATMNGVSKAPGLSDPRCGSNLHQCAVGETITGWLYGFDFTGQQYGQFNVSANSTASPFGYWSDSIYIK